MPDDGVVNRRGVQPALPSPTLRDVLAVLFRQRRLAVGSFVVFLLAAGGYWMATPVYKAHMKVLLSRERADPVITPDASGPLQVSRGINEEDLNSEVELLRDESLLRLVVEANGMASPGILARVGLATDDHEHRVARGVRTVARRLRVEPVRKSNLIVVSYESSDPARAARVLERLAELYVEKHAQVHRQTGQYIFFAQQAEQSRAELAQAQARFVAYNREGGVVSAALERDNALQRNSELERTYRQQRIARADVDHRIQVLQTQMASFPARSTSTIRTSDNPQLLERLKGRLLELQLKRTELLKVYEPSYRTVREVDEQIAHTQASIVAENETPVREETTEKDPNYEWAKAELEKAYVEQSALAARGVATANELLAARVEARRLGEAAVLQEDLMRDMKTAEQTYLLYARKSEEARVGDALDERGILNVTIAEAPIAPVLPQRSFWMMGVLAVLAAAAGSITLSFAADYLDPALRTPEDVIACLHVPVLASFPRKAA